MFHSCATFAPLKLVLLDSAGVKIMAGQSPVMSTGQISFSSVIICFGLNITGQNDQGGKDLTDQVPILVGHCLVTKNDYG